MARNKVDTCLFCGCAPCECNKPAKPEPKKRAQPKLQPQAETVEPKPQKKPARSKPDFAAAMKAAAQNKKHTPAPPPAPIVRREQKSVVQDHDPAFKAAIQALAPILHPTLQRKYAEIIDTPLTIEERRIAWRERRDYERGLQDSA